MDYSHANSMLITGSRDGLIRGWNPHAVERPLMVLQGNEAPIMYIRVNDDKVFYQSQTDLMARCTLAHLSSSWESKLKSVITTARCDKNIITWLCAVTGKLFFHSSSTDQFR